MKMYNNSTKLITNSSLISSVPDYCGFSNDINNQIIFCIEGVLLSVVGLIGVLANIITFHVLSRIPSNYNIFNKLLMQLVSGDSVSIIFMFVDFSLRKSFQIFSLKHEAYATVWPNFVYPFTKLSYTWIMCQTIAITIERYLNMI